MASALHSSNKLLASLPRDEYEEIGASLRPVSIRSGVSLCRYAHSIRDVYFPGDGAFSLERISDNGQAIEIAIAAPRDSSALKCFTARRNPRSTAVR